jgi:3-methyl-2-oxobutanoate hydroxymethyltransferase
MLADCSKRNKWNQSMSERKRLTIPDLAAKKAACERLVMVAVGEALTAAWAERAGVDIVGVGDSLGMTLHGHENTLAITVDQMIMHCQAVRRGAPNTFCLVSMPYGSYATPEIAVINALRLMKESGAEAVKLQLGREGVPIIRAVADAGVPVMSHVGLLPHRVHMLGGFKMQGRAAVDALRIIDDARAIEEAGAIGLEIEAVPYEVGKAVDEAVSIFTFSIGAGAAGTCQLLNGYDLIGGFDTFKPKFAKRYANIAKIATKAFADYAEDVRAGAFPDDDHSYKMNPIEAAKLAELLKPSNPEQATGGER